MIGSPADFLNNPSKLFSYRYEVPSTYLPEEFASHKVNIELFYIFKNNQLNISSFSDGTENENPDGDEAYLTNTIQVIKEPFQKGILEKCVFSIDNHPVFCIVNKGEVYDRDEKDEGFLGEYPYTVEIKNINILDEFVTNDIQITDNKYAMYLGLTEDNLFNFESLSLGVFKLLELLHPRYCHVVDSLLTSCFDFVGYLQMNIQNIHFINLDRRENKRFINREVDSIFKSCLSHYFNKDSKNARKIHLTLERILPLFDLPAQFKIEFPRQCLGFLNNTF